MFSILSVILTTTRTIVLERREYKKGINNTRTYDHIDHLMINSKTISIALTCMPIGILMSCPGGGGGDEKSSFDFINEC